MWPRQRNPSRALLLRHFGAAVVDRLVAAARTFPLTARVDLQQALERQFATHYPSAELIGIHSDFVQETLGIVHLVGESPFPILIGPLQHDEIDVGDAMPARCLRRGLWLARAEAMPFAVLLSPSTRFGGGIQVEVTVPPGEAAAVFSRAFLEELEKQVAQSGSYRGKVLSLEMGGYTGTGGNVKVHRLRPVDRDEVILPHSTLRLLERNVHGFLRERDRLHALGLPVKKGLLFYGPPGTGKTHTIHYLASRLPDHTTLLITSEQVVLLDQYFQLARFLQPAMVVIEDVDLIAHHREELRGPWAESMLNKLLNEMDGLREDARLLFVLTTNRPDQLEAALSARPGRIDQAIEFPLPDAAGRRKLVSLYARGVRVPDDVMRAIVDRTDKASPAFIKELMRRAAQYQLEAGAPDTLGLAHVQSALEEMLFAGGSLNVKLLGGAAPGG